MNRLGTSQVRASTHLKGINRLSWYRIKCRLISGTALPRMGLTIVAGAILLAFGVSFLAYGGLLGMARKVGIRLGGQESWWFWWWTGKQFGLDEVSGQVAGAFWEMDNKLKVLLDVPDKEVLREDEDYWRRIKIYQMSFTQHSPVYPRVQTYKTLGQVVTEGAAKVWS